MKDYLVFVYGTLRQGECNHALLAEAELLSLNAWTFGKLYDTGDGYPCMYPDQQTRVVGELYAVTGKVLKRLDQLEGYRGQGKENDYERQEQEVYADDETYFAHLYIYSKDQTNGLMPIPTGDWLKRGWD